MQLARIGEGLSTSLRQLSTDPEFCEKYHKAATRRA
jgi:hypothetical protein